MHLRRPAQTILAAAALAAGCIPAPAQAPSPDLTDRVLVVVNDASPLSRMIGDYYAHRRGIPAEHVCHIKATANEDVARSEYDHEVARPVADFLRKRNLVDQIYYIVTTAGVPLRIEGEQGMKGDASSVDSELTLLYADIKNGHPHPLAGPLENPFYGKREQPFAHPQFPIYLVTRLAAYDFEGVKGMIERSLEAANRGKFVLDLKSATDETGNDWLRNAAVQLPKDRVILEETSAPVYDATDVIGYASWGSNDPNRHRRYPGFRWLPGGITTEYVSTDGRSFERPPEDWVPGMQWHEPRGFFKNSPQSMTADFLLEGATGAAGHVWEPFLGFTPRPDLLLPAYYSGRNLAESYYLAIKALSWQNIVVGDPLCSLGKPK